MNTLVFDIKLYIANLNDDVWYKLYLIDDDIRKYTKTNEGANAFIRIAIKEKRDGDDITYSLFGMRHNIDDLPAFIYGNGSKMWYKFGKQHRDDDKPTYIGSDGTKCWIDGIRYRNNDGTKIWHINDERHRDGDKPAHIYADGTRIWYINGYRHRDGDKPACINADGTQSWWINGVKIR